MFRESVIIISYPLNDAAMHNMWSALKGKLKWNQSSLIPLTALLAVTSRFFDHHS